MQVNQAGVVYQFLWSSEPVPPANAKTEENVQEAKFPTQDQLRTFIKNIGRLPEFREVLRRGTAGPNMWIDDETVIKKLIEAIEGKKLKIIQRTAKGGGVSAQGGKGTTERVVVARRNSSADFSTEPDPATFAGNHDGEAQAAALQAAAEEGLAICEECEKKRAAAAD
ncbi:hypothetical protein F183_A44660 [Bryobacterales bacterium F-183]|nr:hypothetical protein F183_A44660 [Bryobacterales bacterium F-183]